MTILKVQQRDRDRDSIDKYRDRQLDFSINPGRISEREPSNDHPEGETERQRQYRRKSTDRIIERQTVRFLY